MIRIRDRLPVALLLMGISLVLVWAGVKGLRMYRLFSSFQSHWQTAQSVLQDYRQEGWQGLDLELVHTLTHDLRRDYSALGDETRAWLPLAERAAWLPILGPCLSAIPEVTVAADEGTKAAVVIADAILPPLGEAQQGRLDIPGFAAALERVGPELTQVEGVLSRLEEALDPLRSCKLLDSYQEELSGLESRLPQAKAMLVAAQIVPRALAAESTRTFLILAQNEDEIRPTGGFITSVGIVEIDGGVIQTISFEDSYAVDDWQRYPYPELPLPFQWIMGDGIWLFRDANWSPDWPTSARQAMALYEISRQVELDGVVAVDQRALELVLGAFEPVKIPDADELVSASNIREYMHRAWAAPSEGGANEWYWYRKAFIGQLALAIKQQLYSDLDSVNVMSLASNVLTAVEQKHLLLYFTEPSAEALLDRAGWAGAMRPPEGDHLMVVDANMGYNKVAPMIDQRIDYRVSLVDAAEPTAVVTLSYSHRGQPSDDPCIHGIAYNPESNDYARLVDQCFWDYVRVYPPVGSEPQSGSQHPVPASMLTSGRPWSGVMVVSSEAFPTGSGVLEMPVLANLLLLPQGSQNQLRFAYSLPESVVRDTPGGGHTYQLVIRKQPGTEAIPVRVELFLPDVRPVAVSPEPVLSGPRTVFEFGLRTDRTVMVEWMESE